MCDLGKLLGTKAWLIWRATCGVCRQILYQTGQLGFDWQQYPSVLYL